MSHIEMQVKLKRDEFVLNTAINIPVQGVTVILGPSGSGKTSLLRLLAGLDKVDYGFIRKGDTLWLDSKNKINISPQKRHVGMVFQDYALFEHMTVEANIGFSLSKHQRNKKVPVWLNRLDIEHLAKRYPHQLSGGQRQRVALARALITEPELLLLDEPFAALDTHLRQQLREQLLEVVAQLKQPVLMVTHDLNEARYLADHVGVMINGAVQCMQRADEIFGNPVSYEVACVLGWRNFLPVIQLKDNFIAGAWGKIELENEASIDVDWLAIRQEHIRINTPEATLDAKVIRITELDGIREIICQLKDGTRLYLQRQWNELLPVAGSDVKLEFPAKRLKMLQEGNQSPVNKFYEKKMENTLQDKTDCLDEKIRQQGTLCLRSV